MGWAGRTNNVIKAPIGDQINVKAAATNSVGGKERRRGVKAVINVALRLGDAGMGDGMEVYTTDQNLGICLS